MMTVQDLTLALLLCRCCNVDVDFDGINAREVLIQLLVLSPSTNSEWQEGMLCATPCGKHE